MSLLNKGVFGSEDEKEEAKLEYKSQHKHDETSSGSESDESEEEEIEKHKVKKVKHRLIDSVAPFQEKLKEVGNLNKGKYFVQIYL